MYIAAGLIKTETKFQTGTSAVFSGYVAFQIVHPERIETYYLTLGEARDLQVMLGNSVDEVAFDLAGKE